MSRPSFIGMVGIGILGALVALQVSLRGSAQSAAWVDPARHTVRFVDLPGAGHYVFLAKEADVLREIHSFVAALPMSLEKK